MPNQTGRREDGKTGRSGVTVRHLLAGLGVVLLVAACSSGNAREAERGQAAQASETARLSQLQATYSAGFINPGTPTPAPTPASLPTLERLVLAGSVGNNGPAEELASVPANFGTVYAGALLNGLSGGTVVSALWRGERGNVYTSETRVEQNAAQAWVGLPLPLDGSLAPGAYAVIILVTVGDEPPVSLNSLVFEITASGSSARALQPGLAPRIVSDDDDDDDGFGESGTGEGGQGDGQGQPPIEPRDDDD